jgi:hypothetical protein
MVYNEEWFLPHFLDHYRALGIVHFIFYDDRSTDRTRDILLAQDDCSLIVPEGDKSAVPGALSLQTKLFNDLPEMFGRGAWSLIVDADEFLVLPEAFSTINDAVRYLEARDFGCALAMMIDFYPERLSERFYDPLSPFAGSPWFDCQPSFTRTQDRIAPVIAGNGVRTRLLRMLATRHPQIYRKLYGTHRYRFAKSWKVPLLKTGIGIRRPDPHIVDVHAPFDIQLGLAHFKFYPGLDRRIRDALERRSHYMGAIEYQFLQASLELLADEPLIFSQSRKYSSPRDLEAADLIWTSGDAAKASVCAAQADALLSDPPYQR